MKHYLFKLCVILMLFVTCISFAADENEVIVPGNPPITMKAVNCHMRLIEFVIGTRLTFAQKNAFLDAIKNECAQMPEQDKINFLSACELVDSMKTMDSAGHEAVKFVLKKDFEDTAKGTPGDPAADLFLKLNNEYSTPAIKISEDIITNQSLAALVEYLEFVAFPMNPEKYSETAVNEIKKLIETSYLQLNEDGQAMLDDFQLTWYMIRAGWQATTDQEALSRIQNDFKSVGLKPGMVPNLAQLKACLATELYADLLDKAAQIGVEPAEWSASSTFNVW